MTDGEIVKLFWKRNENALEITRTKYGSYCRSIAFNILRNGEDAEECVNDSLLNAWNSIPPNKPRNLRTYLGKLVRNVSINRFEHYSAQKRGGTQTELAISELENSLSDEADVFAHLEGEAITRCINTLLKNNPKEKRIVFVRRYWYFDSIADIAKAYSLSESKVTSILFRMRKELKEALEKEGVNL
ncbi:MAG: RNA polymerase sigma factor [Clostridia bacterium]|nr:RNA polymerase sigma factor [Clostridia bacterium]